VAFEASDVGRDGRPAGNGIWLADVVAGTQRLVVREEPGAAYLPVLSADGTRLAWTEPQGRFTRIVVQDLASGERSAISAGGDVYEPSLSADGTVVAFTTRARDLGGDGGRSRVYVRRLGDGVTRLASTGVGFAHQPAVSGDGARVAFVARRQTRTASILGQRSTLQVADVAGGRPVTAFAGRGWSTQPALSRDGGRLVATTTAKVGAKPFGLAGVIVCDLRAGGGARLISTHRRGRPAPEPPHADHGGGAGHDHG
jgi:Tol biopolymer transport system component